MAWVYVLAIASVGHEVNVFLIELYYTQIPSDVTVITSNPLTTIIIISIVIPCIFYQCRELRLLS